MTLKLPNLANGPPPVPRASISVSRCHGDLLSIGFNGKSGGHAEIVTIADAEALAERLQDWIAVLRFEQMVRR